jgi:HD-GYP domain-containing protein (c-di-GMP phosphodiesterase class II)
MAWFHSTSSEYIKKVSVNDLQIGMYIHDLNCNWRYHPFFFNHFRLSNEDQLKKIRAAGIKELYIDVSRGLDLPHPREITQKVEVPIATLAEVTAVDQTLTNDVKDSAVAQDRATDIVSKPSSPILAKDAVAQQLRTKQLNHAREVHNDSLNVVSDIIQAISRGGSLKHAAVQGAALGISDLILESPVASQAVCHLRKRDHYWYEHAVASATLLGICSAALGHSSETNFDYCLGGLLLDLGKAELPPELLLSPDTFSDEQMALMRTHVERSLKLAQSGTASLSPVVMEIISQHHERLDGSGYPRGLVEASIGTAGRLAGIIDVYDAMISDRPHRNGQEPAAVIRYLLDHSGRQFDRELVHLLIKIVGIYPIGSMVQLTSGRFGVVINQSSRVTQPVVRILFDDRLKLLIGRVVEEDLSYGEDRIVGLLDPELWRLDHVRYLINTNSLESDR